MSEKEKQKIEVKVISVPETNSGGSAVLALALVGAGLDADDFRFQVLCSVALYIGRNTGAEDSTVMFAMANPKTAYEVVTGSEFSGAGSKDSDEEILAKAGFPSPGSTDIN